MSDEMSLALTRRIENLFAKEYVGGEVQRRAAIQCAINEVISADLAAERERHNETGAELAIANRASSEWLAQMKEAERQRDAALAALKVVRVAMKALAEAYVDVGLSAGMGSAEIADELAVVNTYAALAQIDKVLRGGDE